MSDVCCQRGCGRGRAMRESIIVNTVVLAMSEGGPVKKMYIDVCDSITWSIVVERSSCGQPTSRLPQRLYPPQPPSMPLRRLRVVYWPERLGVICSSLNFYTVGSTLNLPPHASPSVKRDSAQNNRLSTHLSAQLHSGDVQRINIELLPAQYVIPLRGSSSHFTFSLSFSKGSHRSNVHQTTFFHHTTMSPSDEPRTLTYDSNAPSIYPCSPFGTAATQPFPGVALPEDRYHDLAMTDRPNEGFVDILDRLQFETRESETTPGSVPAEEPYNEETGLLHVKRLLKEQEEDMRREWKETQSEASKSCGRGQAEDYRRSLAPNQSRSLIPRRPVHPSSQGGRASQRSGVSKRHPQPSSRQPTTARPARSTDGGRAGAKHNAGGGASVSWSRHVVGQSRVTVNDRSKRSEGKESTVNQIQHATQGMGLGEEGEKSSVNDIGQGMQEMSIDRK